MAETASHTTDAAELPLGLEHALLGLVRHQPMHAYEMHQQLLHAEALGLVWHLKQGHLYALLARLEAAGYLAGVTEPQGTRPPRKILHLTPAGEAAFARWLQRPVAHGRDFRLEFLAKLYFAAEEGPTTVRRLIATQRTACQVWLDDVHAQAQTIGADRPYDRLVLRFRIGQIEAILPWLDECEEALAQPDPRG
jgi:PadR family transcriptional regulator, regulatory protein AphA